MRLPPLLQPWAAELGLFPLELASALGDLLLRLHPLLGPFVRHGADAAVEPAGTGDIARRGNYERLLLSEWAVADGAPDEFLRRAANAELLFSGPEPATSVQSLRSVVLFDAGPFQLGAPRLVHLAMFILLARRAAVARAGFQWGVLQEPGVLHANDRRAVLDLLAARIWAAPAAADAARWDAVLDDAPGDCWLVGDPAAARPARVRAVVAVRQAWHGEALDVALTQRGRSTRVSLPLPGERISARLLRHPFTPERPAPSVATAAEAMSLKRPPMFGTLRDRIAVCMVNGTVTQFLIPHAPGGKPGRPRNSGKLGYTDEIVAAGMFNKSFGAVANVQGRLRFFGFPGPFFRSRELAMPMADEFHAVPGAMRWARAFHLQSQRDKVVCERVLVLDKSGRLVSWTMTGYADYPDAARHIFEQVASDVVGAVQQDDRVLFAVRQGERIDAYALNSEGAKSHVHPIMHGGDLFHFGDTAMWRVNRRMYALRLSGETWLLGSHSGAGKVQVEAKGTVLGCAWLATNAAPGLVVMNAKRTCIELVTDTTRTVLARSTEPIAQASYDPEHRRIAWLSQKSGVLTVQAVGDEQPLLRTLPR